MKKQTLSVVINVISTPFVTSQRPGFGTVLTNTVSTSKKKEMDLFVFFVYFLIGYIHYFLWFFQNMGPLMLKSPHSFSIKMLLSSRRWLTIGSLWLAFPKACNNVTRRVRCRGDNDPALNKQHFRRSNWVCLCCSRQQTGGKQVRFLNRPVYLWIYLKHAQKGRFLTSKSARLMISTPHSCPRLTSSASNASISTMVLTVFPFPLAHSRMIWAFCATSQIIVEMEPGKKGATMIKIKIIEWNRLVGLSGVLNDECGWHGSCQGASSLYLSRWCSRWTLCRGCHTAEPPPGSTCNRPPRRWSTGSGGVNQCER